MIKLTYQFIEKTGKTSEFSVYYEKMNEAEETAHSMQCGVFDGEDVKFKFIRIEQE